MGEADPEIRLAEAEAPLEVGGLLRRQPLRQRQRLLEGFGGGARQIALADAHVADLVERLGAARQLFGAQLVLRHRGEIGHRPVADLGQQVEPAERIEAVAQVAQHEAHQGLGLGLPLLTRKRRLRSAW